MKQIYEKPFARSLGDILEIASGQCSNGSVANSNASWKDDHCTNGSDAKKTYAGRPGPLNVLTEVLLVATILVSRYFRAGWNDLLINLGRHNFSSD